MKKKGILDQMLEDEEVQKALEVNNLFYWMRVFLLGVPLLTIILIALYCR